MSVSNPVESGGMSLNSFDRDLQGFAEKLNTVGGWAELMAEDSKNNTLEEEETKRKEEIIKEDFRAAPRYVLLLQIPLESEYDADELYFFFGGNDKISDMSVRDFGRIFITFRYKEDYAKYCLEKKIRFSTFTIHAYPMSNDRWQFAAAPSNPVVPAKPVAQSKSVPVDPDIFVPAIKNVIRRSKSISQSKVSLR